MKLIRGFVFVLAAIIFLPPAFAHAQTQCPLGVTNLTPDQKVACQAALVQTETEKAAAEVKLTQTQSQSASLTQAIAVLTAKIKVAQLDIKAKNLLIQTLGNDIVAKQSHINDLEGHIAKSKETLAQILRKTNEVGSYSIPEIVLSQNSLTGFLQDVDTFQSVQQSLANTFDQLRSDEASTSAAKDALNARLNAETDARYAIQQQEKAVQSDQADQKQLLSISKGNEKAYSSLVAQKAALAAQIRAALFPLAGGGQPIPFGDALRYAQEASKITSVRPAFLLAIITQESSLGANIGSCLVTDLSTGNGVGKNTGTLFERVMYSKLSGDTSKRLSDTIPFVNITKSLGRNWSTTPVSCPLGDKNHDGTKYYVGRGFGGAMGPAQFIPSTWDDGTASSFSDRVARALGISLPDPWNPEHAFIASALYLADLGALNGSYTGEIRAACSYFGTGGSSCSYGRQVISKANTIQANQIDLLQ